VVLCAGAIFATVPFGRRITEYIDLFVDDPIFTIIVVGIFAVVAFGVVRFLIRSGGPGVGSYLWFGGVAVGFCIYAYSLRENAVETLHFFEYELLSFLIYRALFHRPGIKTGNYSIRVWAPGCGPVVPHPAPERRNSATKNVVLVVSAIAPHIYAEWCPNGAIRASHRQPS
jgi:hypothetical protein